MISVCDNVRTNASGKELRRHGSDALPVTCYDDNMQELSVPWHWHPELEFGYVIDGRVSMEIASKKYEMEEGDGFLINSEVMHAAQKLPGSGRMRTVVFHPRLIGGSMESLFWEKYLAPIIRNKSFTGMRLNRQEPWQEEVCKEIRTAWKLCAEETSGYEIYLRNALSLILLQLWEHKSVLSRKMTEKELRDNERIKCMLQFIQENYAENITLSDIAQAAAISKSECLRCFHDTLDKTPIVYLREYRLARAAEQLNVTTDKITLVAEQCGFQEMSYFAKSFRELYGVTPTQYREGAIDT